VKHCSWKLYPKTKLIADNCALVDEFLVTQQTHLNSDDTTHHFTKQLLFFLQFLTMSSYFSSLQSTSSLLSSPLCSSVTTLANDLTLNILPCIGTAGSWRFHVSQTLSAQLHQMTFVRVFTLTSRLTMGSLWAHSGLNQQCAQC